MNDRKSYDLSTRVNNSALGALNPEQGGSPEKYQAVINNQYSEQSASLNLGDLIHRNILQDEDFVVLTSVPGEKAKMIADDIVAQILGSSDDLDNCSVNLEDYPDQIMNAVARVGYGAPNWKADTIKAKIVTECGTYFSFVMVNKDATLIDMQTSNTIAKCRSSIFERSSTRDLMRMDNPDLEYHTEFEIYWDYVYPDGRIEQCKSKLDRLIVDHAHKTFHIIDLKTTSHGINNFQNSFKFYHYHRQIAFYEDAVLFWLKEQGFPDYVPGNHYIVVVETTGFNRSRSFKVSEAFVELGKQEYKSLMDRLRYHIESNNWLYDMEESMNGGVFLLSPEN